MAVKKDVGKAYGIGYSDVLMQLLGSLSQPIRNPDKMMKEYRDMVKLDETVGTGLEFLCYSVVRKMQMYSHPDERVKTLVDGCIERMGGTIEEARRSILFDALAYGFGISEFTLGAGNGEWNLSSLQSLSPATLSLGLGRKKDNSLVIDRVIQNAAGKEIVIPADKCWILRHKGGGDLYGQSRLQLCWRWYAFKRAVPKFWAIALERNGMPMLVGKSTDTEAMATILRDAYSQAYASIGFEDSIETVGGVQSGINGAYESAVNFCNKMIYRALFLPSLLEGGESGGSYSLGGIHWRMFDDVCLWLARELAESELEHLWRPIIGWNLGEQEEYGTIAVTNSQTPEEQEALSRIFLNGVNSGMLYPDEGDSAWMRERLGFPAEKEGGAPTAWRSRLSQPQSSDDKKAIPLKPND